MNFLSMDYFLMTAEKRSFTKAADALHITQQTLSTHIANLEQELDCKLFVRHVPLELTYAGEIFHQYAADFQKKYRAMQHEFADLNKNEQGILRIGISFTRCHAIMPGIITEYQKRFPQMEIQVIENANTGLQKDLMEHRIDLAIAKFPDFLPGITLTDFYEEEVVLLLAEPLFREVISDTTNAASIFLRLPEIASISDDPSGPDISDSAGPDSAAANAVPFSHQDSSVLPASHPLPLLLRTPEDFSVFEHCPFLLNYATDIAGQLARYFISMGNFKPIVKTQSDNMGMLLELCAAGKGACISPLNLAMSSLSEEQRKKMRIIHLGQSAKYKIRFGTLEQPYQWKAIRNFMDAANAALTHPTR